MAQNDFSIANQGFPSFRADLNDALQSLASQSSGSTAPPSPTEYQWWFDTSSDVLKVYNPDLGNWIDFATFNLTTNTWTLEPENINGVVASASNINATQYLSNRNLIINGSGRVNQRGYVGTSTSSANEYTLDRWRVVISGQSLSFSGDDAGRTMTAPAGGVEQEIEGANILSQTYVISFVGTATCTVDGVGKSSGDTVTLTKGTNTTVRFSGGTFSDVQLESGDVVTPFEKRSIEQELALCQRYYWQASGNGFGNGGFKYANEASDFMFCGGGSHPVTMRATPSFEWTGNVQFNSAGLTGATQQMTQEGFTLRVSVSNPPTSYRVFGGTMKFDAEL